MSREYKITLVIFSIVAAILGVIAGYNFPHTPTSQQIPTPSLATPSAQTINLTYTCTVIPAEQYKGSGWTATFTNNNPTAVSIAWYNVIFFNAAGAETGSQQSFNTAFTIASNNSYTDNEDSGMGRTSAPDDSSTCQVANWTQVTQ